MYRHFLVADLIYHSIWGDFMKFAEIEYFDDNIGMITTWFNSIYYPYSVKEKLTIGAEGYKICLNIPETSDKKSKERVLAKIKRFLLTNDIISVTGERFDGVYTSEGNVIKAAASADMAGTAKEAVIIGGNRELVEIILCSVCPHVKYVSIFTGENYVYNDVCRYLFTEYGITVQMMNSLRHENLKNADIVINCAELTDNYDYLLKNGCIYFDIANDKKRIRHIRKIRPDVRIINAVNVIFGGIKLTSEQAECAVYATDENFRRMAEGKADMKEKIKIIENIRMLGSIDKFYGFFDGV